MILVPRRNSRRLIHGLKIDTERSKDELFFIKYMPEGSAQAKCYLVQVDMENSYHVYNRDYRVYYCWWYIINMRTTPNILPWSPFLAENENVKY